MKKHTYVYERAVVSYATKMTMFSFLAMAIIFASTVAGANVLGTAGEFNTFIFGDFSCSSDTEGRLAVGGNAYLDSYSVADKLTSAEQALYDDMLVVGGDLTFTGGRVYYGNIVVGGEVNAPQDIQNLVVDKSIPVDFAAEEAYLKALSQDLTHMSTTGTAVKKYSGLKVTGDNKSTLQVFNVDGDVLPSLTSVSLKKIPSDATIIFNISGTSSGLTGGWQALDNFRTKVLYNFYEATTLSLKWIGVNGSVLAPYAHVDNPSGVIYGTVIAASWDGLMQQNHHPFEGGGIPEPEDPEVPNEPIGNVTCGTAVVDGQYDEWDLTEDLYAKMYEAGKTDKDHMSSLYLRYDVLTGTMNVLVLREGSWEPDESATEAWVKIYDLGQSPMVDGNSSSFQWVYEGGKLIGYEASFLMENTSYLEFEAHITVNGGRTSSTGKKNSNPIPLTVECQDAPPTEPASLGDFVWEDINGDGIQDADESGVEGVTVKLYLCDDTFVNETATDADGKYLFEDLEPDSYYVKFSNLPDGYVFTEQGPTGASDETDSDVDVSTGKTECTTLESGENDLTWDAGIVKGAGITKYQRLEDSDEWSIDSLYDLEVGEMFSYQISVENFNYDDDLGFTIMDTLSDLVDFSGLSGVEIVGADGTIQDVSTDDYFFNYDVDLHALSLDYTGVLQSDETLNFLFDVTVNDGFGSDMVITNQADVAFTGDGKIKSNVVDAYAVPEPGTIALLGLGLFGLLGLKRKFKK